MMQAKDARERQIAVYMIETGGTVRSAAQNFGISKSTVHKDMSKMLERSSWRILSVVSFLSRKKKNGSRKLPPLTDRPQYCAIAGSWEKSQTL